MSAQIEPVDLPLQQVVTVAKAGGDFLTIQAAIDSIIDASITKQYMVKVAPGIYTEAVVIKPYVHLSGVGTGTGLVQVVSNTTPLTGTVQDDAITTVNAVAFACAPSASGQCAAKVLGAIGYTDCFFSIQTTTDIDSTGVWMQSASGSVCAMNACSIALIGAASGGTQEQDIIRIDSAGQTFVSFSSARVSVNQNSGELRGIKVSCTGEVIATTVGLFVENASTSCAAWNACGFRTETSSTFNRVATGGDWRFKSNGGGTFTASHLDSGGNSGRTTFSNMAVNAEGFTNNYVTNTDVTDTQQIWLNSTNIDLSKTGTGLSIVTPYDELKSGFIDFGEGSTYWSYNVGTRAFTIDRRVSGIVKSSPVVAASGASATLTNYATNYIYLDSTGAASATTTANEELYLNNIVMFQLYSDGTNYIVAKENHPYKFTSAVSHAWHRLFGSLLEGTGAVVTVLSGANRTIRVVGADVLTDHGLDTTIPDSAGAAVDWTVAYTGPSGTTLVPAASALAGKTNETTTNTFANAANGRVCVYRLGVIKDSINSTAPQYIAVPNAGTNITTATFGNLSAARTAANANNITLFPAPIKALEIVQLGFALITANGSGGGTLNEVIVSRQTFAANFNSAAAATSAGLVTTNTTNFNRILSSADTSVQLALDTLDNGAVKGETGDIIHTSMTLADNQAAAADVTGLVFSGVDVRAFRVQASIAVTATASLYEEILLEGVYNGSDWLMSQSGTGNDSLVTLSITSAGQVQYTTPTYTGYSTAVMKFRALVTLV